MRQPIKYISPLLVVADIKRSRDFYETVLNQKVLVNFGENITFEGNFTLHQKSHYQSLIDDKTIEIGGNDFELYFEYDDMDEINQHLKDASVLFVHEMREQPWRQRVLRIFDPDNHILEIGESMENLSWRLYKEGLSVEKITKICMMPENVVRTCIEKHGTSTYNPFSVF